MSEVSRPLQLVLILAVAFAGLWFVALRPKSDTGRAPRAPATQPAKPAPHKSALPGGLGRAVDKANATKRQGDAQAAANDRAGSARETAPPPNASPPSVTPSAPGPRPAATAKAPGLGGVAVSPSRRAGQVV